MLTGPERWCARARVGVRIGVLLLLGGCIWPFRSSGPRQPSMGELAAAGDIAALAKLPALRLARLPSGQREIRVWFAMSTGAPDLLLRVATTTDKRRATGQLYAWWVLPSGDGDRRLAGERRDQNDRQRDTVKAQWSCASIENAGGNEACRLVLRQEPDWKVVLSQLDSLRAWSLPDQDSVARVDSLIRGAVERRPSENMMVTVEALDGAVYRTYSYTNPRAMPADEARRAAAIVTMINDLARRARRPDKAPPRPGD